MGEGEGGRCREEERGGGGERITYVSPSQEVAVQEKRVYDISSQFG